MKYGIMCAMPEEIALLREDIHKSSVREFAQREFIIGTLYNQDVVLVISRIGKVAAAVTATILINHFGVDAIIFSGTAGGIDPDLNVGDVVIADQSVQHDFKGVGVPLFSINRLNVAYFQSDKMLSQNAFDAVNLYISSGLKQEIPQEYLTQFGIIEPKAVIGTIASGDQFICEKEKNLWLYEHIDNLKCVEMEGASVAQVCYEFSIPYAIVRVISDSANEASSVDFDSFIEHAACHFTKGSIRAMLSSL